MKIHKFNKQLIFLEEILFTCMFAFGVIHITFGMLYIKTGQAGLKLMVEILDIPFFVSFMFRLEHLVVHTFNLGLTSSSYPLEKLSSKSLVKKS